MGLQPSTGHRKEQERERKMCGLVIVECGTENAKGEEPVDKVNRVSGFECYLSLYNCFHISIWMS